MTDGHVDGSAGGRPARRALVYGDVDLNLIDGSAIWATSVVEVLARAGCEVTLLLKARVRTDRLIAPLEALPGVHIVRPFEDGRVRGSAEKLDRRRAAAVMADLDAEERFDVVVVRGFGLIRAVVAGARFDGRLWSYLTDVPQSVAEITQPAIDQLSEIARASHFVLCQTEELRSFLETTVPATVGRCVLFPPVLPPGELAAVRDLDPDRPLRLGYAGKFAPLWNTEAMTTLPARLATRGVSVELHVIGDKIHQDKTDPRWASRMESALKTTPGLVWHGGRSRAETMTLLGDVDVGLGWRDRALDASLELSTKVLEYGALGLPVILARTPMHEDLLGADYPLFADDTESVVDAVVAMTDPAVHRLAAERCRAVAERFTQERAAERVRALLEDAFPRVASLVGRTPRLRVVVAGHDFKFMTRLMERWAAIDELEVRVDDWPGRARHDTARSQELVDWADVVVCEWCGPNAIWYAEHKRSDQRLYVRLHRFELYRPWPAKVDIGRVDRIVCVSPHYADLTVETTGWPTDKVAVIPNWVDMRQLDRPKLPDARFHLGMIGVGEQRKRFDLALDVLAAVRREDPRFLLLAKTKMPWEYPHIWDRPHESEHARAVMARVQNDPLLRGRVVFDAFGPDVATWLRRVGFLLSTSDDESFHLAPAEGMASRAVPVVRSWPGADTTFDPMWVHDDPAAMAASILSTVEHDAWQAAGAEARSQIDARYALDRVAAWWADLIATDEVTVP